MKPNMLLKIVQINGMEEPILFQLGALALDEQLEKWGKHSNNRTPINVLQ